MCSGIDVEYYRVTIAIPFGIMDAVAKEDVVVMEGAVAVAVSADVPDVRDTPDDDKRDDKGDDKKRDDNNDDDRYDDNVLPRVDDVVAGPEHRRQITNTAKWK